MAAHLDITVGDTLMTLYRRLQVDDSLRKQHQRLRRLERRAGCLRLADGLTDVAALRSVRRYTEYFTIVGRYGYDAARLATQQAFAQLL